MTSFLLLVLALLAPVFAVRFTVDLYRQTTINTLKIQYSGVLAKYGFDLKLATLRTQSQRIKQQNDLLYSESKRLQERITVIENHLYDYSLMNAPLKVILNSWRKDDSNWMILQRLTIDGKTANLTFHELYVSGIKPNYETILESLSKYYRVSKLIEYETTMPFLSRIMAKVTIAGSR